VHRERRGGRQRGAGHDPDCRPPEGFSRSRETGGAALPDEKRAGSGEAEEHGEEREGRDSGKEVPRARVFTLASRSGSGRRRRVRRPVPDLAEVHRGPVDE